MTYDNISILADSSKPSDAMDLEPIKSVSPKAKCLRFIESTVINVGYTRYNLYAFIFCIFSGFHFANLYAIVTCTSWGIFSSFHASLLVDPTAFHRIAEKMQISMSAFHIANFLMHILPCILTVCFPVASMHWWHGVVAAISHLTWGLIRSGGTLQMDELYVPMPTSGWYLMWSTGFITEVAVSLMPLW